MRLLLFCAIAGAGLLLAPPAQAASVTWTGLGSTNNWSDGANWSTGSAPAVGDIAIFDTTATKNATINAAVNVAGIQIAIGYTGTITQVAATTVGPSGFSQADGTFLGSGSAVTVNGPFSLSSGNFTSTSGTLSVSGNYTHTGGALTPNGGTVRLTGGAATITVPVTETLNNLVLTPTTAGAAKTVVTGNTLIVQGTLTLTEGLINTGTVAAQGAITQASTFDGGTGLLIVDGAGDQTFTGSATTAAGSLPNLEIAKPSGTLTLVGTIRTTRAWTYTAGALDPATSTVVFAGTLTVTGSHSLNAVEIRGAVTVAGGTTLTAASLNMPSSVTFTVNGSVIVTGTLTLTDGSLNTGTVAAQGAITQASTFDGGTGSLIVNGAGDQTFTGSATTAAGSLPNLEIAKPSGTLTLVGTIRTTRAWTYTAGALDPATSTVVFAGTLSITGSHSLNAVEIRGAVTLAGGTSFTAASLNMPSSVAFTVNGSVTVTAALTLTDGSIAGTGTLSARGDVTQASTFDGGTGSLTIDGAGAQSFTGSATTAAGDLPALTIAKPSGTLTLAGTLRTTHNWTYTAGALDPATSTVVFAGTLTVTGSHALANVTFNGGNSTYTVASGTTVSVTAALALTDGSLNTGTVAAQGAITQASTFDGGTGSLIVNGAGDQTFTGSATTAAGSLPNLEIAKPSGTLTLVGTIRTTRAWTYTAGALDPATSTVVFAGTLSITGSHSLNAVEIRGAVTLAGGTSFTAASLNMPSSVTFTVNGSVIVTGTLTLTDGSLNTGTVAAQGAITQASTFDGGTGSLIVNGAGDQTFTGSAITAAGSLPNLEIAKPSGTLTLVGTIRTTRAWTYTAGALDPATSTVVFAGTLSITGSHSLNAVEIRGAVTLAGGTSFTAASLNMPSSVAFTVNGSVTVTAALTLTDGSIAGTGTLSARGDVTQASTFDGGTGSLTIDGAGAQSFTGSATTAAGDLPALTIAKPSGTLTLAGTLRTTHNWTYTAGALDPATSTVVFAGTLTVTGSHALANVTFNGGNSTYTVASGTTVSVTAALALTDGSLNTGTVAAQGAITQASTFDGGTGLLIVDGAGDQTFTGSATTAAGSLPNLEIAKPSGTLTLAGTLRTTHNWTYTAGALDPATSTVVFAGTLTVTGSHALANVTFNGGNSTYTVASGTTVSVTAALALTDGSLNTGTVAAQGAITQASTFDGGTGSLIVNGAGDQTFTGSATTAAGSLPNLEIAKPSGTLTLAGTLRTTHNWTYTAGALDPATSTVVFAGTLSITGSHTLANVTFATNSTYTVAAGTTVTAGDTLTLTNGSIAGTGTIAAQGAITQASTFDGGTGNLAVDGGGDQTFVGSATATAGDLPALTIAKPSGTLTLVGTIRTTRAWTYTSGALDTGTSTVVFAGTLSITGSHTLANVTFTTSAIFTVAAGTTVTVGDTLILTNGSIAGTGTIAAQGAITQASSFDGGPGNLTVDGGGDQTFVGSATATAGDLPVLTIAKPSGTLSLAGTIRTTHNWTYTSGALDAGTSTVVFAGTELVWAAGMSFSSVTVDGGTLSGGVTVAQGPLVVTGTLALVSGTVITGPSKVVVTSSGDVVRTSGHVVGNLQKSVPTGSAVTVGFEIGDASTYAPAVVSFATVTAGGDLTASTVGGDHPDVANSGVSATSGVNRWWTIERSGIAFDSYGVILNFVAGDLDPSADSSRFIVAKNDATTWTQPAVVTRSATSIEAGGMTSFSDFVVGEPAADVRVTMVGSPEPVLVGANLTYALNVSNAGPSPASSVMLTDTLPTGMVFVSATSSQGSCSESNGTVICDLGALASNATATLTIAVSASVPGSWVNTATLTSTEADPDPTNNTAAWTSTVNPAADVRLTMVGSPEPVLVGANLTYALNVSNAGPSPASSVMLTDTLPTGMVFVSATSSQGSCSESNGTVICDLGALASNATATLTIAVSASVPGSWVNTATLTSTEADPDPTNNTAAWTSTVNPAADVRLTMVGSPEPVLVGANLTYALNVSNAGPSPASSVMLTDTLPTGMVFVSATSSQGSCSESNGTVICDLGALASNATATLTIAVSASVPGSWVNTATLTSTEADPDPTNNTAVWTSTVNPASPRPASGSPDASMAPTGSSGGSSRTNGPAPLPRTVTGTAGSSAALITSLLTPTRPSAPPSPRAVRQSDRGAEELHGFMTETAVVFVGLLAFAVLLGVFLVARRDRSR